MQTTFQQISEVIERLDIMCGENALLAQIEKEILLEQLRNIYLKVSALEIAGPSDAVAQQARAEAEQQAALDAQRQAETERLQKEAESRQLELDALKKRLESEQEFLEAEKKRMASDRTQLDAEMKAWEERQQHEKKAEHNASAQVRMNKEDIPVEKGMTEDVDLFFDLDHESYAQQDTPQPEQPVEVSQELVMELEGVAVAEPSGEVAQKEDFSNMELISDEDELLQFAPSQPVETVPVQPVPPAQPKAEPKAAAQPTVTENAPRSLNDLFNARKEDRSLGAQFQNAKVGDLTKAISINEKFTYIKELFSGRGEEFSAAIQKLNQCTSMEEAFNCLEGMKKRNYWDATSNAYLSLCDLLRRKFN